MRRSASSSAHGARLTAACSPPPDSSGRPTTPTRAAPPRGLGGRPSALLAGRSTSVSGPPTRALPSRIDGARVPISTICSVRRPIRAPDRPAEPREPHVWRRTTPSGEPHAEASDHGVAMTDQPHAAEGDGAHRGRGSIGSVPSLLIDARTTPPGCNRRDAASRGHDRGGRGRSGADTRSY